MSRTYDAIRRALVVTGCRVSLPHDAALALREFSDRVDSLLFEQSASPADPLLFEFPALVIVFKLVDANARKSRILTLDKARELTTDVVARLYPQLRPVAEVRYIQAALEDTGHGDLNVLDVAAIREAFRIALDARVAVAVAGTDYPDTIDQQAEWLMLAEQLRPTTPNLTQLGRLVDILDDAADILVTDHQRIVIRRPASYDRSRDAPTGTLLEHLETAITDWVSLGFELVTSATLVDVLRGVADDDPWDLWLIVGSDRDREHLARIVLEHLRHSGHHHAGPEAGHRHPLAI